MGNGRGIAVDLAVVVDGDAGVKVFPNPPL